MVTAQNPPHLSKLFGVTLASDSSSLSAQYIARDFLKNAKHDDEGTGIFRDPKPGIGRSGARSVRGCHKFQLSSGSCQIILSNSRSPCLSTHCWANQHAGMRIESNRPPQRTVTAISRIDTRDGAICTPQRGHTSIAWIFWIFGERLQLRHLNATLLFKVLIVFIAIALLFLVGNCVVRRR